VATGEIVNWLNSDDYYENHALWKVAKSFMDCPSANVVCGRERAFDSNTGEEIALHDGTPLHGSVERLIFDGIIDQPPTFFRKRAIDQIGPLSTDLHYTMDSEWWMKYLLIFGKNHVRQIPDVLVNFRIHPASKSVTLQDEFDSNRNTLKLELGKLIGVPDYILSYIRKLPCKMRERSGFSGIRIHPEINIEKLKAQFSDVYFRRFYQHFMYDEARQAFDHYLKYGEGRFSMETLSYYLKIRTFPESLTKKIRLRRAQSNQ